MNRIPLEKGRVARSMAGRDEGRLLVVLEEVDDDFVFTADGDLRTLERPKKKRRKHLKGTPTMMDTSAKWPPENHELRKFLLAIAPHEEG